MNKRAHLYISGEVIDVGFRAWTVENAQSLGLVGWVRNASGNLVETVFEGKEKKAEEMIERCHSGPGRARVEKVEVVWEEATGEFEGFVVRY